MTQAQLSMAELVLQDVTHQLVQQFMAELQDMLDDLAAGALSERQERVLNKILAFFDSEMKVHHLEEEGRIFPMLLSKGDAQLQAKVRQLQQDHVALRQNWQALREAIEQAGAGTSGDAQGLHACFARYSDGFARHLLLEESIQFDPGLKPLFLRWDA